MASAVNTGSINNCLIIDNIIGGYGLSATRLNIFCKDLIALTNEISFLEQFIKRSMIEIIIKLDTLIPINPIFIV